MATLVFDIETAALPWDSFDETTKRYLLKSTNHSVVDGVQLEQLLEIQSGLGLSPLTGQIITIGVYDLERRQGVVYYQSEADEAEWQEDEYVYRPRTEKEMLEDFWEGARSYDVFVTFAGRSFDVPFLAIRSAAHTIVPTKNLAGHRYLNRQIGAKHVDLQDQLSFYGAMNRRPSLHLCTRAFGIESSKEAGISGGDVAELFLKKQFCDIARYNARDVTATSELYNKWYEFLAPASFKNFEH